MTFDKVVVIVLRRDGIHHQEVIENPGSHHRKWFEHRGHRYEWNLDHASRLLGWLPWERPTINPIAFLVQWVKRRLTNVGLVIYAELPDKPDTSVLISPLSHANYVSKGYTRVSPVLLRGAFLSQLYKRYEKATPWGIRTSMKTVLIIFGIFALLVVMLYFSGVWN